ncbi:DUF3667 domain-containing protein [Massilia endophytica]|uniref:DUF3667 domain-containing protein n=1 Tax=Massilia endophytica TaxID=2899220 RepID=UPI001E62D10D|nr:DUF3667 domain-containing protein [Massilia endophytica]UGQ45887.1 DUF3667 domain-containing protein [Massilia endophytica]
MKPAIVETAVEPIVTICRNCNATAGGNYCHNCGQETRLHAPSFGEFLHEFVGHYVALEGRLWGTIGRLLFRPGALTNEYLAGRRRRFVEPLRLYLTLSILFFALFKFSGTAPVHVGEKDVDVKVAASVQTEDEKERAERKHKNLQEFKSSVPGGQYMEGLGEAIDRFDNLSPDAKTQVLKDGFFRYAPYAMFLLMPLFAVYLKLLYLGTGRRYGEHLLFALHTNSFAFIMFGSFLYVPDGLVKTVLVFWLLGYLPWAMRRVYQKRWFGTIWRWLVLALLHTLSLGFGVLGALGMGVALAH